ncbi:hypothetical protein DdX_19257 [Ditylenchus destructor]|uniref:F-box domain-containing protein n=1 Tax=Ditylenchus destructor TaxID=166010 RepID=A0AAD4MIA0_9BILA|nr:hypothetical protein DdX_19257 [Ditylenchus destructor]
MDNGTMVEAFKYLNYTQLAKKSLVSKRFCNLIRNNRKYLARLYVDRISMDSFQPVPVAIKVFNKELSTEAYNEWVICNNYSKQVPLDDQLASMQSRRVTGGYAKFSGYQLSAVAYYTDPNHREWNDRTSVFSAQAELNQQNWPVFEHFVRLATDPFIYIDSMNLTPQNDVLNLLAGAINSERRLQCNELSFYLNGNSQKSFTWAKNHVRCNRFYYTL